MKRKMLISIALITIMLLNCMMPLFVVNAADGEEIQLNSKLYTAVKNSLIDHNIAFTSNDITHTITISDSAKAKVTELDLNEGGISNVTGLDAFTSLTHLELSGNNLTKNSNLETLNSLPLTYLDLSTNQLEDVSMIDGLISAIQDAKGTVILSGQTVTIVEEAIIDEEEDSNNAITAKFDLPLILEKAGFLKSVWLKKSGISEDGTSIFYPTLKSLCNPVAADNREIEVRICSDDGYPYKGLFKLEIYIYDDPTEAASAANLNPAATNMLNGSRFYIYVVVHGNGDTAITTPDSNLYRAIKKQLTAGQTENKELESYTYSIDANGNTIYDEFFYEKDLDQNVYFLFDKNLMLDENEYEVFPSYVYDVESNAIYEIDYGTAKPSNRYNYIYVYVDGVEYRAYYYTSDFEQTVITVTDNIGQIHSFQGFKFAHINTSGNRNLYVAAYDEAKTFVIDNTDLVNKITSLILNNKEIRDLTGLDKFIGLNSDLNVSHNYLDNIDPIYNLQNNKDSYESYLQSRYTYFLNSRPYGNLAKSLNETKSAKSSADAMIEGISKNKDDIIAKFKAALELKQYTEKEVTVTNPDGTTSTTVEKTLNENYEKDLDAKAKEIKDIMDKIYGYYDENGEYVEGTLDLLEKELGLVESGVYSMYGDLYTLYRIYNNEYKLTTLLTPDLNYQTLEEYEAYKAALNGTTDSVKSLYMNVMARIGNLIQNGAISAFEEDLINNIYGTTLEKYPEFLGKLSEIPGSRLTWVNRINEVRELALYSEMANYCLIKRMETNTAQNECYCEEYLKNRIKNLELEGIDTSMEEAVYARLTKQDLGYDKFYSIFENWMMTTYEYTDGTFAEYLPTCYGEYTEMTGMTYEVTNLTLDEIATKLETDVTNENLVALYDRLTNTNIISKIVLKDSIYYDDTIKGNLELYNEVTALAGKFVANSSEVSKYVTIPKLKKLDISYNAYLEGIERLSEFTNLKELYANANYITDISEVNWEAMKYLRKLGIAYNYIPNIEALEVLEKIVEIDASHNLIAGEFKFNFTKLQNTLKSLDLSYNQIEDITDILKFIDFKSNGDDGNYLARPDTLNINLNNQSIKLFVEEPIYLTEYPETIDIELPKIFTQLMAIDVERTAFGETSQNGRIESEGKYVTLNTRTVGEKEGVVEVIAMSGNGTPVETCIGKGTKATIKYYVDTRTVNEITVTPIGEVSMLVGTEKQFTAEVKGENLKDTTVTWSIEGNTSENTTISEDGLLKIAEDEGAETIKVVATSNTDNTKSASTTVNVLKEVFEVTSVTVEPAKNVYIKVGETKEFKATVEGENVKDTTVTWKLGGNTSENTTISEDGIVTVAEDEEAEAIVVTATSNADKTKSASVTVNVVNVEAEIPEVTSVKVSTNNASVEPGKTTTVVATVEGKGLDDTTVTWSIEGNTSENTNISKDGKLTIANDETAESVKVIATSNYDSSKSAFVNVKVVKGTVADIKLGYTVKDEYLTNVKAKTPVEEFKKVLLGDQEYNVEIKKDGKTITSGYITTGMYVQIQDKDGNVVKDSNGDLVVYGVIVKGDINGDGVANSLDSLLIKAHRTEVQVLKAEAFEAADIDNDGKVTTSDAKLLLYHRAEVKGYNLNYAK